MGRDYLAKDHGFLKFLDTGLYPAQGGEPCHNTELGIVEP